MSGPTSVYDTPMFWERLWRTAGIQAVVLFIIAYVIYRDQRRPTRSLRSMTAIVSESWRTAVPSWAGH